MAYPVESTLPVEQNLDARSGRSISTRREENFHISLCGQSGVGKTTVFNILKDMQPITSSSHGPTDNFTANVTRENGAFTTTYNFKLWDTAGLEKFRSMTHNYFYNKMMCILVYSSQLDGSLEILRDWITKANDQSIKPLLSLWDNERVETDHNVIDEETRKKNRDKMMGFGQYYGIPRSLCFQINALADSEKLEESVSVQEAYDLVVNAIIHKIEVEKSAEVVSKSSNSESFSLKRETDESGANQEVTNDKPRGRRRQKCCEE